MSNASSTITNVDFDHVHVQIRYATGWRGLTLRRGEQDQIIGPEGRDFASHGATTAMRSLRLSLTSSAAISPMARKWCWARCIADVFRCSRLRIYNRSSALATSATA